MIHLTWDILEVAGCYPSFTKFWCAFLKTNFWQIGVIKIYYQKRKLDSTVLLDSLCTEVNVENCQGLGSYFFFFDIWGYKIYFRMPLSLYFFFGFFFPHLFLLVGG